jgi:hypothetical protein
MEMGNFTSEGVQQPYTSSHLDEENENSLILSLINDLNKVIATGLCEDRVVDQYLDKEVSCLRLKKG